VAGSVAGPNDKVPFAKADGTCDTSTGPASTVGVYRIHNFIEVHYPRQLNDCSACHINGSETHVPNPTQAVGVTFDAGAAPWGNQLDDALIGPSAQSCFTCHQSGDPLAQWNLQVHATGEGRGWYPTVFTNGRQTLIDAVKLP
jgi:hypothetical protein